MARILAILVAGFLLTRPATAGPGDPLVGAGAVPGPSVSDTPAFGPGSDAGPGSPGSDRGADVNNTVGPGSEVAPTSAGPSLPAQDVSPPSAPDDAVLPPAAAIPTVVDFAGAWKVAGTYGEHFRLVLKAAGDGTINGTYYVDTPQSYPRGEISGGHLDGAGLLATYRYHANGNETDRGKILFTLTSPGQLKALWTNGDVSPSEATAGGAWIGER